jgi:hypothetical protein
MPATEHMGVGKSLHDAAQQAYKEATENKGEKPPFVVDRIELHGDNPFTEYRLFIKTK